MIKNNINSKSVIPLDPNIHKFEQLKDQKSPCAIFIGNKILKDNGGFKKLSNDNYEIIMQTVQQLRKHNIDAVPVFSELAENPSKTVVTPGGIQTPFLKPNKLEKAAKKIFNALDSQTIEDEYQGNYKGYTDQDLTLCSPVEFSHLAPAAKISQNLYASTFTPGLTHPNNNEFEKLREQYGWDLEFDLIKKIDIKDTFTLEELQKSNQSSIKSIYRGGCFGDTPYISFASRENKAFAYATPDINCAKMYSGLDELYGVWLCATSPQQEDTIKYGLIYEFEAAESIRLYNDWGMENGRKPRISAKSKDVKNEEWNGNLLETTVSPSKNNLKNIFIHIHKDGKEVFYPIPTKDKKWQAFLALHRSSDTCLRGYMIERRENILMNKEVFSSLNNKKIFGIFPTKVKSEDFNSLNKQEAIEKANLTIEEKQAQKKQNDISSPQKIGAKIYSLRNSKAKIISLNYQNKQKVLQTPILKMIKNKNIGNYS